jgi:hypothetical protein
MSVAIQGQPLKKPGTVPEFFYDDEKAQRDRFSRRIVDLLKSSPLPALLMPALPFRFHARRLG